MQQNMMGHNIIITEPSSNLRALGRNALAGKWKVAILAYMLYLLCTVLPPAIFNVLFGINVGDVSSTPYAYDSSAISTDLYSQLYNSSPSYSVLSPIYILLVSGAFVLGITIFFLALFRKQQVGITDIFLGFERFGKALGLLLFQTLFIILWSLIGCAVIMLGCVVMAFTLTGGTIIVVIGIIISTVFAIIASIKYSQSFFILSDNPDKGVRECVNESKLMMKGNKAKYFMLELSFIGWMILACIPMGIIIGILNVNVSHISEVVLVIVNTVANLFMAPVCAYIYSSKTGFYEILAGHLIKETEPASMTPEAIPVVTEPVGTVNVDEEKAQAKTTPVNDLPELVEEVKEPHKASAINPREILENNDNDKEV